ncbi:MAG: hypothetical protein ABJQ90_13500, partial [Parasphingorhabdus sp.]
MSLTLLARLVSDTSELVAHSSVKIVNGGKRPGAGVHGVVASPEFIPQLLLHSSPLPMSGLTIELTTT